MNIIFCAYAYIEQYQSGHNISADDIQNTYLKNCYVALKSSKYNNPDCRVVLVTNLKLNKYWEELFKASNLEVIYVEFNDFLFDKQYGWSLAFYKLCALKYILTINCDNVVMIDTDVFVQRTFDDIWKECKNNILLYDISRGLYNQDYSCFCNEAQSYLNVKEFLPRYGGEFIAGNTKLLNEFINRCESVYLDMLTRKFITVNGDEFIVSIAAQQMKCSIKNAAAYVFRYWTAYRWHYVCSNYVHNPVCVLHCPREKDHGFVKLFNHMSKSKSFPSIKKVYRLLNLNNISYLKIEFINKLLNLKN